MFYFVKSHILWLGITCLTCLGVDYVSSMLPITFLGVVGRGVICALGVNVFYAILWSQSKEFKYFLGVVLNKVLKR